MDRNTTAEALSALDAAFLYFERPEQPLVVGCVAELDAAIDPVRLLERLERLVQRYPRFRQRPIRTPLDLDRPAWEDDPEFALIRHFRTAEWPAPGDAAGLRSMVETVLSSALPSDRPRWEIVSIAVGAEGRAAAVLRAHHCMLDGTTAMRLIDLLSEPTDGAGRESRPKRARRRDDGHGGSAADADACGRLRDAGAPAPVWDHMRDMAELTATLVSLLHDDPAPATALNAPLTSRRRATWATFEHPVYEPLCTETGTTTNELALSVIAGALRRYLWRHQRMATRRALRTLVPVSLRTGADADASLGNRIAAMFPRLPIDVPDPLERLERISTEVRALRARGQPRATAYGLRMMGSLPPMVEAALPMLVPPAPIVNTVCTSVPGPKSARSLAGGRILSLHGIVPLFHGMGVEFSILTHDGRLSICAHLDPNVVSNGDELAGDLEQAFEQLRRAERRTRKHRREIKRLARLMQPVSRLRACEDAGGERTTPRRASRRDVP